MPRNNGSILAATQMKGLIHLPDMSLPEKQQEIAELAFQFWLDRAFEGGSPEEDLFRAEREIKRRTVREERKPLSSPYPDQTKQPLAASLLGPMSSPSRRARLAVMVCLPRDVTPDRSDRADLSALRSRVDAPAARPPRCELCDQLVERICHEVQAWAELVRAYAGKTFASGGDPRWKSDYHERRRVADAAKGGYFALLKLRDEHWATCEWYRSFQKLSS